MYSNLKKRTLYGIILGLIVLFFSFNVLVDLRLEYLWFQSLEYASVYWQTYFWKGLVGLIIFLIAFLSSYLNLSIAFKRTSQKKFQLRVIALALVIGLIISVEAGDVWFMILQAINRTNFAITDPQFSLDVSFYVFLVPFIKLIYRTLMTWLFLNLGVTVFVYLFSFGNKNKEKKQADVEVETKRGSGQFQSIYNLDNFTFVKGLKDWKGWRHSIILLAILIGLQALSYGMNIFDMMYGQGDIVAGAGATDIGVILPGNIIMAGFSLLAGLLVAFGSPRKIKQTGYVIATYIGLSIFTLGIVPGVYQQFVVSPNEISKEIPYLERSIKYTNMAYGLNDIEEREYPVGDLTIEELKKNQGVLENIRILDQRATLTTYSQQQELRPYYEFADVDVDRYLINGKLTQVMISAREMNQNDLPAQAKSFNNTIFQYTHGFGLVMSPANRTNTTGLPDYFIKDIPPVSQNISVSQPRIYYGEKTVNNVIVKSKLPEFDYTDGENNQEYFYEGNSGIHMNWSNRLLLAFRDMQYRYIFSGYITNESLYLETRNIRDRAIRIAPFLWYDTDPYIVLTEDGGLVYILDAYTQTNRYPYSQAANEMGYNYIRNSVKVTVDAYSGDINFYVFDDSDPMIDTYAKIYPDLFKERSEFPKDLISHIRYPEVLFQVQSLMLQDFHMQNPVTFYNREDRWSFANQIMGNERMEQDPYYTISTLPGESKEEFVVLRNFTPYGRQNMIAWLAGRSDDEDYGKLLLFTFTKGTQVPGPMQVESQIDQNPEISGQLSLWGQGGSTLIRGNLLVYPVGDSLLYVEPLYMESTQNRFPQLKRIFLYYKDRIVMEESLTKALEKMFPGYAGIVAEDSPILDDNDPDQPLEEGTDDPVELTNLDEQLLQLIQLQSEAKIALANGDWARYGEIQAEQDLILAQIEAGLNGLN